MSGNTSELRFLPYAAVHCTNIIQAVYYDVLVPNTTMIPGVWGALPPSDTVTIEDSWYDVKGGSEAYSNPLATDPTGDA